MSGTSSNVKRVCELCDATEEIGYPLVLTLSGPQFLPLQRGISICSDCISCLFLGPEEPGHWRGHKC